MDRKDPYEILGVDRHASPEEVKRAYRRLAKESHPDRNPGNKAAEKRFKEIRAAYEVLGDSQRREQYDRFGAGGPRPEFHTWTAGSRSPFADVAFGPFADLGDLTSIFEQFFSRGAPRARTRRAGSRAAPRGADIEHAIDVSFEEATLGTVRDVVLTASAGSQSERIRFRVPPGIDDGQRIRVKGKGQDGPGGRGDLLIRCRVSPHACFRRDGLDLLLDLPLSIAEAAFGTRVDIPTLSGPARVTVPPGTASGTRLRLRGRGITDRRTGQVGDLYALVRVELPKQLSDRAGELLKELDQELGQQPRRNLGWPV